MRKGNRFGAAALFLGALALVIAVAIFEVENFQTFNPNKRAVVLGFLDKLGLVKAPDMRREVSATPAYVTSINDTNAFEFLRLHAWWFSLWAIGIALFAEARRETTLFMSAGCICACFALLFLGGTIVGMVSLVGCSVLVFLLRSQTPNPSIEGTSNSKLRLPLAAPHVKR